MAQLDWAKLFEPYQSWSRTLGGAEAFLKANELNKAYPILLEGKVEGFVLKDYSDSVCEEVNRLISTIKEVPWTLEDSITYFLSELQAEADCYAEQDEIISVNVIDFSMQAK